MMSDLKEQLTQVRDLLQKGWTKGALARNQQGDPVFTTDVTASCYCSVGAIYKIEPDHDNMPILNYVQRKLYRKRDTSCLTLWNDTGRRKKSDVINFFNELINEL